MANSVSFGVEVPIEFNCNICSHSNRKNIDQLTRENASCDNCSSNVRFRQIVNILQNKILKNNSPLIKQAIDKNISGVGISDNLLYANILREKISYINTFFHSEPRLDICSPSHDMESKFDFLIATEVFEHVLSPVQGAFDGAYSLLKPGGVIIFSVPFTLEGETVEHFPNLHDFEIKNENGKYLLYNKTIRGEVEIFDDLIFHGGPGSTLEMRLFSKSSLIKNFKEAGFKNIVFHQESDLSKGINVIESWSLVVSAEKK